MNSQLTFNTAQSHRDDLLRAAESSRGARETRRSPRPGAGSPPQSLAGSLELRAPRLRPQAVWRRVSFTLSTFATIAIVALVVTLSSSSAASRTTLTSHTAATTSAAKTRLGLVRDPRTGAWMCIRVTHRGHPAAR